MKTKEVYVTFLQIRLAYEEYYKQLMPQLMSYQEAAERMQIDMGKKAAMLFISSQSNKVDE